MGWRERVEDELVELQAKCDALTKFLDTPASVAILSVEHVALLRIQLSTMETYVRILRMRLDLSRPKSADFGFFGE